MGGRGGRAQKGDTIRFRKRRVKFDRMKLTGVGTEMTKISDGQVRDGQAGGMNRAYVEQSDG